MSGGLSVCYIAIHKIAVFWCYNGVVGIDLYWNSQMGERGNERENPV